MFSLVSSKFLAMHNITLYSVPSEVLIIFPCRLQEVCHWIDIVVRLEIQVAHWNWNITLNTDKNRIFVRSNNIIKQFNKNKNKKNHWPLNTRTLLESRGYFMFQVPILLWPSKRAIRKFFSFENIANSDFLTILENSVTSWNNLY